jgi:hypothetical protein
MRRMVTLLFALFMLSGVSLAQQPGQQAETAAPKMQAPPSGDYKPLTLWDKIKLGSAYYTDPQLIQNTSVAYSFDPLDFAAKGKGDQLYQLAVDGHIAFGTANKASGSIKVQPSGTILTNYAVHNSDDLKKMLGSQQLKVLSVQPELLGQTSDTAVVKSTESAPPK